MENPLKKKHETISWQLLSHATLLHPNTLSSVSKADKLDNIPWKTIKALLDVGVNMSDLDADFKIVRR